MQRVKELARGIVRKALIKALKPIYVVYEKWLWAQIKGGPFPTHIGIIPDGNRRWARERGLDPLVGHVFGYEKIKEVLKWLWELKIPYVTIFAMSTENCLYRSWHERKSLFDLAKKGFNELLNMPEIHENRVRILVVGKFEYVPDDLKELVKKLVDMTSSYDRYFLTIALCYGGRQEIIDAVKKIAADVERGELQADDINEEVFMKYLYTGEIPDLDLVIRTSGEERISNFLLWHSAYTELYFCDVYWPEFRKIDFWRAIRNYQMRERRFGR